MVTKVQIGLAGAGGSMSGPYNSNVSSLVNILHGSNPQKYIILHSEIAHQVQKKARNEKNPCVGQSPLS